MFVTLFLGLFDPAAGRLEYVNAGHIPPTVVVPGAAPRPLAGRGNMPVGVHEGAFAADAETIAPGSGLLVVTDGITEAASPGGEQFGMARLERVVAAAQLESAEALVKSVTAAAEGFRESLPQQDDVTVFALIHRAGGARA
jgi:sigma-B regulation protein RsbU (phosphoserine phosphatase)